MILSLLASAFAAETFDAHGFRLGAFTDEPTSPLEMTLPGHFVKNSIYFGGIFEYAKSPLVYIDGVNAPKYILDDVLALNLAVGWAPISRLRLNVSAPLYFTSMGETGPNGVDFGDIRVGADAVILDGTFSLGVVPFIDLPTGAKADFLGQSGVAGGGLLAAKIKFGRSHFGLNAGPYFQPSISLGNLAGVDRVLAGGQLGIGVSETLGIGLETRTEIPFEGNTVPGTDLPVELMLYGHNRFNNGAHVLLGGAVAVSQGASAATYRVFLGGGFGNFATRPPVDTDGDGLMDPDDKCPLEPETVNGYQDTEGCPDTLGAIAIEVTLDGKRVVNAGVSVAGTRPLEVMSAVEPIVHKDLMPGDKYTGVATYGPCMKGTGEAVVPEGTAPLRIALVPDRGAQVRLEIYDANDKPLNSGLVTWERETTSCVPGEPLVLKDTHIGRQSIGVGTHTVFVTVANYNTYVETVQLVQGDDKLIKVKLAPTKVVVTKEKIEILEKVFFEFDGDKIDPKSGALLDEIAATLRSHPEILSLEVGGHTDSKGKDAYNLDLSQRRTNSVRTWLIAKGVAADRLLAKGYGETKPIQDNKTDVGRANNRRVEFLILKRDEVAAAATGDVVRTVDEATQEEKDKAGKKETNQPDQQKIDSGK